MTATAIANSRELLARVRAARAETDALFGIVRPEFLYDRPIAERHRLVFYIGHLEAFDWNLLSKHLGLRSSQAELDRLFAFGIDPVGGDLPTDQPSDWPSLSSIHEYRDHVREALDTALEDAEQNASLDQLLNVAIEHRLMHAETLAYLFHQLAPQKKSGEVARCSNTTELVPSTAHIPAGPVTLGLRRDGGVFGWDNEFDGQTVDLPEFLIDKYKITNRQFLDFIEVGGYENQSLWAEEDWEWKESQAIAHPAFWVKRDDVWMWKSMFGDIPLPDNWPVYVSHAEATAYAKWTGGVLPTEAQWQRAAYDQDQRKSNDPVDGVFDPSPVNDAALSSSAFGVDGMYANGWEWTSSKFEPFAGFQRFDCYPGYSEPFFDGKHFVLKGGSVRTAASMLRPSFRNWFQPHYQYVYAGFRCVRVKE